MLGPWKKSYDKPRQNITKQRYHFANKGLYSQSHDFSSSHVQMCNLDHKERWVPKNWCFWIAVLKKTFKGSLDSKEIKPVNPKGNQLEYSLEGLMLKQILQFLATWCDELTHWKRPWFWERLRAGGEGDSRDEMGGGIIDSMDMSLSKLWETVKDREA